MQLDLTQQEVACLRHCVTQALALQQDDAAEQPLKNLLEKVVEAEARAFQHVRCPVCQQLFVQESRSRAGRYCSAACKQKAYRLRRNAWRRDYGPVIRDADPTG